MTFPRLFSPLRIGPVEARNRVVCGAHFTMYTEPNRTYGEPGFYGERYGRYLAEYARGGVGTVIAGQAQVHPDHRLPDAQQRGGVGSRVRAATCGASASRSRSTARSRSCSSRTTAA